MKKVPIAASASDFSGTINKLSGNEETIIPGKELEFTIRLAPESRGNYNRRKIGALETKGKVKMETDFKVTTEEFLDA